MRCLPRAGRFQVRCPEIAFRDGALDTIARHPRHGSPLMKFMLLIGGSRDAWARVSPEEWSESVETHGRLIAELKQSGEFVECNELASTPEGSRIVRQVDGVVSSTPGPLHDDSEF